MGLRSAIKRRLKVRIKQALGYPTPPVPAQSGTLVPEVEMAVAKTRLVPLKGETPITQEGAVSISRVETDEGVVLGFVYKATVGNQRHDKPGTQTRWFAANPEGVPLRDWSGPKRYDKRGDAVSALERQS